MNIMDNYIIYTGNDIKAKFKKFMKLLLSNVISNRCMCSVKMIIGHYIMTLYAENSCHGCSLTDFRTIKCKTAALIDVFICIVTLGLFTSTSKQVSLVHSAFYCFHHTL